MTVTPMPGTFNKFKRIRSLDEVLTRGGQALSAYREQRRGGTEVPSDEEFTGLIDRDHFGDSPVIAETIWSRFFRNGAEKFFLPFRQQNVSAAAFEERFGPDICKRTIAAAEGILDGRIDLMGLKGLYVGRDIDWHREPVSLKRSPLKHWKGFDDLDSSETGNKKIIWELNRQQHFFTLGVSYWLTGDEKFARTFVAHISSWMDDNPPGLGINWASSLEISFRAMSWIWAFHFFKDSEALTPDVFHRALKYLYLHGRHIERYLSKYYSPNTHLTGEALGLYYLGTQLPFLDRSAQWRKLGENILFAEIEKQVLSDGVYFEQSTWYQRYTADFFAHFVVLRSLWSGDEPHAGAADLEARLESTFDFLMRITLPDGTTPLIGDDDGGRMLPLTHRAPDDFRGTLALSAVIFDRPDHKYVSQRASEELFWLMGADSLRFFDAMPATEPEGNSRDFSNGGYCVMRDGWSDTDNYLIVDCGEVGSLSGGHGHADALSVEIAVHGRPLLVDSGTYTYHEAQDLRNFFRSTAAHNTLEVDGVSSSEFGTQFSWQSKAECSRNAWISTARFDYFDGCHKGYERLQSPAVHHRSILFIKNDYWIIRDLVETNGEHDYSLNFHFDDGIRASVDPSDSFVDADGHRLYCFADFGEWDQKESWISKNHGSRKNAPFLRYLSKGIGAQEFYTFLLPRSLGSSSPPSVDEVPTIHGRKFRISFEGYMDTIVVNDRSGTGICMQDIRSDFEYNWMRSAETGSKPDEMILINGSAMSVSGSSVISARTQFAEIRRLGNMLNISTNEGIRKQEIRLVDRRRGDRRGSGRDRRQSK